MAKVSTQQDGTDPQAPAPPQRAIRALFIQVSWSKSAEYSSHRTTAEHLDRAEIDSYFMWQEDTQNPSANTVQTPGRDFFRDFGRDMNIKPSPSRRRRGLMMLVRAPGGLIALARLIRRIKPDVLYTSQQDYDVLIARILSRTFRIPHIIHAHYPFPWLGERTQQTILRTPRVVGASEFIRQGLIEGGVDPRHVYTRHSVIPLEPYDRPKDRTVISEEFGWGDETQVIVAAGRLDPSKGHVHLFAAFAKVAPAFPSARVLVCGEATQPGYDLVLRKTVDELGLDDRVVFAGNRPDMPKIYAGSDIFCLPTEQDACPLVFLEAMTSGLPTVAVRSGGVPEMVADRVTGLLCEPGDVDALAENLTSLLSEPVRREQLGAAGKARVFSKFAPPIAAAQWTEVIRSLLAKT